MPSNITPNLEPTRDLSKFRFWCQKVLPLVYDDAISYYEVLGKVVDYLNTVIDNGNTDADNVEELADDFLALQTYVNNFFADIDQLASYATRAETAATAASASAVTAATQAGNAASSAGSAATSASNSASSALTALGAETDAVAAKNAAESAATAAGTSETNAGNSATAAAGSATAAAGSATDAASSATAAAGSATSAQGYADSADHYKDGANTAALKAEGYAVGKQNGEAVPSDSPYYHDNAAYWAGIASGVVQGADGAKAQAMIADAEASSTATSVHEKGTTFRYDGDLYVALSDIAVGDTITPNTNCKVVTVSEYIDLVNPIYNSLPSDTASGNVASFDDGAENMPIKEIKIYIEPIQSGSGDPSSVNVRPITGFTMANVYARGKNLYDSSIAVTPNNYINATGTLSSSSNYDASGYIPIPHAADLRIEGVGNAGGTTKVAFYTIDKSFINPAISNIGKDINVHSPSNAAFVRFSIHKASRAETLQIENSTTSTGIVDYSGKTVPISWQDEAGTVYAGTLTINEDESVDLVSSMANIASYSGEEINEPWLSSMDKYVSGATPTTGAQVVYTLSTPITYHLDNINGIYTLLGANNIFTDCGNCNVKYIADTSLYIDKKIEASTIIIELLLAALRNNEMKAPSAMTTNDIIIVNNKLYKATTSIASGATLTVDTNVAEITIGEVLTSLLNT